ncbi:BTB/POZ domain-containing protein KCTD21-like [Erpetoichthys calabaricus]|uniref:BTB/POZ domain-containing protein KCTD21-like n=1 Tax=Erpetoichthys calabaricus TaxID=27687 RepID=UPI00109F56B3|nr:BTB/POZ domain-containing protein KCTD21-like [Erpetoichthys calabaricus]XP_028654157.1 BTB/POZ domain-containing protein KCTD21-like [Erpetoichthys calabaricus]
MLNLNNPEKSAFRDPISLNVGGQVYTTTLGTLTKFQDSMLGAMFKGELPLLKDDKGNYFIDRDGKIFRHILNYLRSSCLDLPIGFTEMPLLKREADFYQIRPLLDEIGQQEGHDVVGACSRSAVLSVDVNCQDRVLHFNWKRAPENYELYTCSVRLLTANVFCTSCAVVELLCRAFTYWTSGGAVSPLPLEGEPCYLRLEWTPRPPELTLEQYNKHRYRQLKAPCGREIRDSRGLVEEMLKVALAQGFRVDSIFPDHSDILNCSSLRFVRYCTN